MAFSNPISSQVMNVVDRNPYNVPLMQDNPNVHILFSDDDPDDALLFTRAVDILDRPILLSFAEDGRQLLKFLDKDTLPDMVFLDLNMPFKSGMECLKTIRSVKKYDLLPIVIYTTSKNPEDINSCYKLGANLYVVKPYSFEDIIKSVKKILSLDLKKNITIPPRDNFVLKV